MMIMEDIVVDLRNLKRSYFKVIEQDGSEMVPSKPRTKTRRNRNLEKHRYYVVG